MKKILTLIVLAIAMAFTSTAEVVEAVKWSWTLTETSDGFDAVFTADIQAGYHIYGMKQHPNGPIATSITFEPAVGVTPDGPLTVSKDPVKVVDKTFNLQLEEWEGTVSFTQHFTYTGDARATELTGRIAYMACRESNCTPPGKELFTLAIPGGSVEPSESAAAAVSDDGFEYDDEEYAGEDDEDFDIYAPVDMGEVVKLTSANTSWWKLLLMGFLGGLLALLTPCVWPMIPMTLSFFMKKTKSRRRSIIDAVTYGMSIIVIFLVLGLVITAAFGAGKLNEIATSAVFNIIFFVLLVVFAISFFGAFDIKLPSKWSNAVDSRAEKTSGILSIFFMAFTLVLVSFSCTGPIIGTLLVEAASDGSIVGPAWGMGGFALGLALPFTVFAFFPSLLKEMPRSGGWMNSVKVVLGFIELILSLKFLSVADLAYGWRILDREVFVALWIVLFALLGMYLLGKLRFSHDDDKPRTGVGSFFLAVISFSFAVYLLPGLWGAPLKAISAFAPPLVTQDFNLYGNDIREFEDYEEGMQYARENNLPVMLDFSGYACVNCRKMEGAVFDTDVVRDILNNRYVFIKLMVDDKHELAEPYTVTEGGRQVLIETVGEKWAYLQRSKFDINAQPYYVILDGKGRLLAPPREYNENVAEFIQWLEVGIEEYNKLHSPQPSQHEEQ